MGKIIKELQAKHRETLSPWLKAYVQDISTIDLPNLPKQLSSFPSRWPFGRGDLYHWIPLLNRFDGILEQFCKTYGLDNGPQQRDFALDVLLDQSTVLASEGKKKWTQDELSALGYPADGDRALLEAVLRFTRMLLEHCGNRSIYASSAHLNDLLNSTSMSVLMATLEVGSELAQRYQASVKRVGSSSRQISSALLANHYNIDLDRVQQMALPFVKTPILSLADPIPSATPTPTKGKERNVTANTPTHAYANDLVDIATSNDSRWKDWADVKVWYYAQGDDAARIVPLETGEAGSLPSTPTPLRRSSTMNTPQQTPRSRPGGAEESSPIAPRTPGLTDDHAASGQKLFELPKSATMSKSIYELIGRCPVDMPQTARYEVFHRLRIIKALTTSPEARQQALAVRLLAITNLAYVHNENNFLEKVLRQDIDETRRFQLVYQLAELIRPSTDDHVTIPLWLQTFALALLEAVSGFQARFQEVLSALNANVNHGILLYVIRKAAAGMHADEGDAGDKATEEDDWRNNLFSLILHLCMASRAGSEVVAAGLMDILVEILNTRTHVAQRHHSMVIAFLDGLIWSYQNAFTAFFSANGLDAVASLMVDTVAESQDCLNASKGLRPDMQSTVVDYQIPYYQQQTLKWLLKFVHHIMSNSYSYGGNTDRLLRNLAEKSDLLQSLRSIIGSKRDFGSVVWTSSVTILSDFINNDPTSFAAISESGMIKTFLEAITGRPLPDLPVEEQSQEQAQDEQEHADDNSSDGAAVDVVVDDEDASTHRPPTEESLQQEKREWIAGGILASGDAINIVPQVLNSICLNKTGMKMVVSSQALNRYLEVFESAPHIQCMECDQELAGNVGANFDELARHHPSLRTSISNAVIDMVARVRYLGIQKSKVSGWGARLLVRKGSQLLTVSENAQLQPAHDNGQLVGLQGSSDGDVDVTMSDALPPTAPEHEKNLRTKELPSNSITPYVHALANFLNHYLSNNWLKESFIARGGMEYLFDICESPSLPAAYGDSPASRALNSVVSQLVEHSPTVGLPSLLRRAQASIDMLKPLASQTDSVPPYFSQFLTEHLSTWNDQADGSQIVLHATQVIKALLNAQTFMKITSDCFATSRSNGLQFYPANVYDYYLNLVKSIGPLLRGVLAEEAGELSVVPQHWSLRRRTALGNGSHRDVPATDGNDTSLPDVLNNTASWQTGGGDSNTAAPLQPTDQEKTSPRFQNYETLRTLLHPMIPTSFPLFQSLGKALLPRREPNQADAFPRHRQLEIAKALADTVLDHLRPSVARPGATSKEFHYWIITLHTIHEMLIDQPSLRQADRSSVHIIMPVLLAFKEQGGLEVLNSMLRAFSACIMEGGESGPEDSSNVKVASFGLKKVLDLYHLLVSSKNISETGNHFTIQRQADRQTGTAGFHQEVVLEFRAAILPAIMKLWSSKFIEKVPDDTIKRLLEILKTICAADHEPASLPKDGKVALKLFRQLDARFNWARHRSLVPEMLLLGYSEDLVHEAVYRANGHGSGVGEYCRAHTDGTAGPRHPIPIEDADVSALKEEPPSEEAEAAADGDRMSIDALPDRSTDTEQNARDTADLVQASVVASDGHGTGDATVQAISSSQSAIGEESSSLAEIKERLDKMRSEIQENLIDQCLDIIRAHPDTAIEVSDLISVMVLRRHVQDDHQDVGSTLTQALSSLCFDEEEKKRNGKCIAAYAHLLALLLQDERFFENNLDTLADKVIEYIGYLKVPPASSTDELPPYIPYMLLVLELLLCNDEKPVAATWKLPKSLDEPVDEPVLRTRTQLLDDELRVTLLESLLDLLPRIGKDEVLATSILRVLVILTRKRSLAKLIGEKRNLQRLFLMAKQLSGSGSERLKQTKLTAHIITVLRHVIEDDDTIKQIMRAEIQAGFPDIQRNQRGHPDVPSYLRAMAPVALRAPDLFVEVTNELLKFSRFSSSSSDSSRSQPLALKDTHMVKPDIPESATEGEVAPTSPIQPSTEPADKDMTDVQKPHTETKRPIVENPDGVIHFLLCELINYREVDDKESAVAATGETTASSSTNADQNGLSSKDEATGETKNKKPAKPVFKAEEHPIFIYRCFLLNCLAELLQSYTRTKAEFINFKRSAPPVSATTPIKPRSSILNYLIYDLLCQGNLDGTTDSIASKKKAATSSLTQKLMVSLVSKTSEKVVNRSVDKFAYDDEPDLLFVRKFVLDTILKAYEKAPFAEGSLEMRYTRMQSLAELMHQMIDEKDRDQNATTRRSDSLQGRSQAQLRRLMYEKGFIDKLTSSIAEISLTFPGVKRAVKYILRVLRGLTATAKELSHSSIFPSDPAGDQSDEEFTSSSSVSDVDDDDREETPDLYRNSALGMLEPRGEDDESDEDAEPDHDEDMYGDEYEEDGMDYEDEISDEDNISEDDDGLSEMGEIEGLSGEPGVVEVIMGEDDDEDEDGSEDEDDDESDIGLSDRDDVDDRVEIIDENGNGLEEDGDSAWETGEDVPNEDDDEGHEGITFDDEVQDDDEPHIHGMGPTDLLDNMARAIMGEDIEYERDLGIDENYLDDGQEGEEEDEDEDEDFDEEEYIYDDGYPSDHGPAVVELDSTHPRFDHRQQVFLLENSQRSSVLARVRNRFSPGRDPLDFRNYFARAHRPGGLPSNGEDGSNPLLRRDDQQQEDALSAMGHHHGHALDIRIPHGARGGGRHTADGPMGLLGELMEFLPMMGRSGHSHPSFHFQITGPGGPRELRDLGAARWVRTDHRREAPPQEPHQAVTFVPESTLDRYQEEARMLFGTNHAAEAGKLNNVICAKLAPAAMALEKQIKAQEAETLKRAEEERKKREEEQRVAREAKEAEERAARERKEAEEREAREAAAALAAVEASSLDEQSNLGDRPMEGIENADIGAGGVQGGTDSANSPTPGGQERIMTTIRGGEEVDVTELGIDPEYLAALPEEFREEVIAQTVSERRSQARGETATEGASTEVFQEFLDALPAELRMEIAHQERQEERRRQREETRRQPSAAAGGAAPVAVEMDASSILLTFPPELREQVLMDQGQDLMDQLTPEMAAQVRALTQQHTPVPHHHAMRSVAPGGSQPARRTVLGGPSRQPLGGKGQRRTVVQMLDKSGVATLLRLMFITQQGSIRNYLFGVFADVCENRQNRLEVISTVLQILQDGSTDMNAVERSFGQLSLKARRQRERDVEQKTPQSLKKTMTTIAAPSSQIQHANSETSPLLIVQQCLDLLVDLCTRNQHATWIFLTEHDVMGSTFKRSLIRKGKLKDSKAHKYAINALLTLLDREIVTGSSVVMTHLADLLCRVTQPLLNLERKRRESADALSGAASAANEGQDEQQRQADVTEQATTASHDASAPDSTTVAAATGQDASNGNEATAADSEAPSKRPSRQLQPPVIPPQNLNLVIKIFVAPECSAKTFQNTISTIKNLSAIPGAKAVFGQELVHQAKGLCENIVSDLDELLPHIESAESGTEVQGVALAKFSPGGSEQNKLLRVLTALDHLFGGQKKSDDAGDSDVNSKADKQYLMSLYHHPTFSAMWEKLSACLKAIQRRENMLNVATILLPLIESLMVVCKNTTSSDDASHLSQSQLVKENKDMVLSSPPPEARTASLFFTFTEEHRRILNELVRNNPKLMSGTFALLVKNPKVLDFDNKRNYFNRSVHSRNGQNARPSYPPLQLSVRRDHVFHDSFRSLYFKSGDEMKFGKLNIRFHGEEGVDAGGVSREWFQVLARQMFDPNYVLFIPVSSDRTTFHPNKLSGVNDEHLMFFKFIGRIIGKALYEGRLLDCFFSRAVYKRILGKSVSVKDMESFDPDYYKSLCWMLENDITDIITETFSVEDDEFGVTSVVDLVPNGRDISVTDENKQDYVRLVVEHKLLASVKDQMENFLKGFHEIIPAGLISIFNEQELELLISGLPDIDIDDWKSNTEYQNYTPSSQQIQWFWRAVRSFDKEERAKLLQFVTGTSKVPLNGFKELEGMNGISRFNIHRDYGDKDRLPTSHTCFNQFDLPEYETYDQLRLQILKAITQGSEYFGFA